MVSNRSANRTISGGQFAVKLVGQFTVKQGGLFILKRGGQLHCNIQIWPVTMKYVKNKFVLMISVILFYFAIKIILHQLTENKTTILLKRLWDFTLIDCMAIGGIFALI